MEKKPKGGAGRGQGRKPMLNAISREGLVNVNLRREQRWFVEAVAQANHTTLTAAVRIIVATCLTERVGDRTEDTAMETPPSIDAEMLHTKVHQFLARRGVVRELPDAALLVAKLVDSELPKLPLTMRGHIWRLLGILDQELDFGSDLREKLFEYLITCERSYS